MNKNLKILWERYLVSIKDLSLWDENPRFPDEFFRKKEKDLIDFYLKDEKRFQIKKFAKEIISEFTLPQVEILTVLKIKNMNVVLEGNRRVAVYKLLVNPKLAKEKSDIEFFESLKNQIDINNNFKIDCNITNNKEQGLILIDRKHKKNNNEVGWGELEKRNDSVRRSKGTIQDVRRVELSRLIGVLKLPKEIIQQVLGKGYVTTLFRIIDTESARKKMGYHLKGGRITVDEEKKFVNLLKVIVYNVYTKKTFGSRVNNIDSRYLNSKEEIDSYLRKISPKDVSKVDRFINQKKYQ